MGKRLLAAVCGICLLFGAMTAGCAAKDAPVLVITPARAGYENLYDAAGAMVARYEGELAHTTLPEAALHDAAAYAEAVVAAVGADVQALVLAPALPGAAEAAAQLKESRGGALLLIACQPAQEAAAASADLSLDLHTAALGEAVAEQAAEYAADALVCYAGAVPADTYGLAAACAALELPFAAAALPADAAALAADIAEKQAQYGADCAFVTTAPEAEALLLAACAEAGALAPLPLSVDPYHSFAEAFSLAIPDDRYGGLTEYLGTLNRELVTTRGLNKRFAAWRRPGEVMLLDAACAYAQDWRNGLTGAPLDEAYLRQKLLNADGRKIAVAPESNGRLWLALPHVYSFSNITGTGCDC